MRYSAILVGTLCLGAAPPAWGIGTEPPGALTSTTLSLPSGPGSVRGLVDDAQASLFSAQVHYSVPIELPGAVRGFRPTLDLQYSGELGNGPLGIGWTLAVPQIRRSLRLGVPSYTDADVLELVGVAGGGRLVAVPDGTFRIEAKGQSIKVERRGLGFAVTDAAGVQYRFGSSAPSRQAGALGTQAWMLDSVVDLAGQQIMLNYLRDDGELYLREMIWGPRQRYRAALDFESRPDGVVSFRRGYRVGTGRRLREVLVTTSGARLRSYRLSYDNSLPVSRLASVTQCGTDGITQWPTLSFGYGQTRAPAMVAITGIDGWRLGNDTSFMDVDGDGVPDLARLTSTAHEYRRNLGSSFGPPQPILGAPPVGLDTARLMDVYGDARPELVVSDGADWTIYRLRQNGWVLQGRYPGSLDVPVVAQYAADLDVDGDGRTDVLRGVSGGMIWYRNTGEGMTLVSVPPIAGDPTLVPDADGVRFFDVNGDGLADVLRLFNGGITFYLGHGDGTFDPGVTTPYPWGSAQPADLPNLHLCDLNRDGLMDLVRVTNGNVEWYRGLPGGALQTVPQAIARPESVDGDVIVSIADLRGDGSQDLVWSSPRGMWALDMAGPTTVGMLSRIDNGLGKVTTFSYEASAVLAFQADAAGQPWSRTLPISIPVPVGRVIDPGAGQPSRPVFYSVRDGFWDFDERRFGGFQTTMQIFPAVGGGDGRVEATTYHLGIGSERVLRGSPISVRIYRGGPQNAKLHTSTTDVFVAAPVAGMPDVPLARIAARITTRTASYEGVAAPLVSGTDFVLDSLGRTVEEHRLGRLDLTGDEQTVKRTFASDDTLWVRDVAVEEQQLDGAGRLLADRKLLFGDDTRVLPFGQIGKGWPREVDEWLAYGGENRWVTTRQMGYDALGQLTAQLANGVLRHIAYDADDLHPVSESVDAQPGTTLTWRTLWEPTLDQPTDLTDPSGQTTHVRYDAIGRPTAIGLANRPAHTLYTYAWTAAGPRTSTHRFDGSASALADFTGWRPGLGWRETVVVADGLGEPLFEATHLDAASFIVNGLQQRDARGRVTSVAEAFTAGSLAGLVAAPASVALQSIVFDALDRPVLQTLPTLGTRRFDRAAFSEVETVTDLAPITRRLDGLGRVIHTERTIQNVLEQIDATYDAANRVVELSLQGGRVKHQFAYDTLGRLRRGVDPDAGVRTYRYDDAGRVVAKTNGANQTDTTDYDGAGRPLRQKDPSGKSYVYHYDSPRVGSAAGTRGRLAWVEEPTGGVDFSYDAQGRQAWMRRTVDGKAAEKTVAYSPSGLVLSVAADDGWSVATSYDGAARPIQVGDLWRAIRLDAAGRVLEERFGNGVRQLYGRDLQGLPSRIQILPASGAALYDVTLGRSGMGVLESVSDTDGVGLDHSALFTYDQASRLTRAKLGAGPSPFQFSYAYDDLQNMASRLATGRDGGVLTGTYRYGASGAGPRQLGSVLAAGGGVTSFAYDGAGRQTQNADLTLGYDGFDQLTSVSRAGKEIAGYGYGYDGQRISSRAADGTVQLWYAEDLAERGGRRQHYVRMGARTLARIDTPASAPTAIGGVSLDRGLATGVALLFLGMLLHVVRQQGRQRRWVRATSALALLALVSTSLSCAATGSSEVRSGLTGAAEVLYFHQGVSAGPVMFTRSDGSVAEERRFEPFGQPLEASRGAVPARTVDFALEPTNSLGKETDPATGFSYHGARWLDPRTARWTEPDPPTKAPDAAFMRAPWKLHPYQYVDQNPISFWDPDGRAGKKIEGGVTVFQEGGDLVPDKQSQPIGVRMGGGSVQASIGPTGLAAEATVTGCEIKTRDAAITSKLSAGVQTTYFEATVGASGKPFGASGVYAKGVIWSVGARADYKGVGSIRVDGGVQAAVGITGGATVGSVTVGTGPVSVTIDVSPTVLRAAAWAWQNTFGSTETVSAPPTTPTPLLPGPAPEDIGSRGGGDQLNHQTTEEPNMTPEPVGN